MPLARLPPREGRRASLQEAMPLCGMASDWRFPSVPARPAQFGKQAPTAGCVGSRPALPLSMPFQRIEVSTARSAELRLRIADAIHRALVETIAVPTDDRFQVLTAHPPGTWSFAPSYLGIPHQDPVLVQVTLSRGRTTEQKQALYRRMAELVQQAGVPPNELVVSLVEVGREDWSFGNGIAQYVPAK